MNFKGELLETVLGFCREAGAEILKFYGVHSRVTFKADESPLTVADQASHDLLTWRLAKLTPDVPVVSEESASKPESASLQTGKFWLVDPLDGTKEFLKGTGDFTVNVALLEERRPILGVVFAPARGIAYLASRSNGAWRQEAEADPVSIQTRPAPEKNLRVVASKDHAGPGVEALLKRLPDAEVTSIGSSLKFCMVAEGKADFYPRFVGTMEWDTAAAQCVVEEAGGQLLTLDGNPLGYGKKEWRNPAILTIGDAAFDWRSLIRS